MAKIMLVDDEAVDAAQLEEIVVSIGHEVVERAASGIEAVARAEACKPELILMDIVMPGKLDGIAAAEKIRSVFDVPVIFITAAADQRIMAPTSKIIPYGYILKPLQPFQVVSVIEVALEKLNLEKRLQQSQKMETLGTLVAGVAHEINNPVSTITMNAPLIQRVWNDFQPAMETFAQKDPLRKYGGLTYAFLKENLNQLIADIDTAGNRVAGIVRDLKDFAKKANDMVRKPIQINLAVENSIRMVQTTLRKADVVLETNLASNLPNMEGNLQHIEQIIVNLILNGFQAIDHDQGKIIISTGLKAGNGSIFISVKDNGRGIDSAIADTIFDPFVTDRHFAGGSGLGLAVTHNLVKAHEGEITFKSPKGGGTTFWVCFPASAKEKAGRILVVDDAEQLRRMIVSALTKNGSYVIEQAANGIEALLKLGTFRPDLLILDIFMPEMDGVQVCRALTTMPELAGMKVIINTGYPEHPKLEEIFRMGYKDILEKPLEIKVLMHKVEELLG